MEINSLRLLIIADDPLARTGLTAVLDNRPEFMVVGSTSGQPDLSPQLDIYQPDVLLWDLGWSPSAVLDQIAEIQDIELPLVILLPDDAYAAQIWSAGAKNLLLRDIDGDKLVTALQAAGHGLIVFDTELSGTLLPNIQNLPPTPVEALTPRELEVLQHLAEGLPNKSIARRLNISDHTVKFHVNAIMSKLGAQSRTEAVVRATQLGLILL